MRRADEPILRPPRLATGVTGSAKGNRVGESLEGCVELTQMKEYVKASAPIGYQCSMIDTPLPACWGLGL